MKKVIYLLLLICLSINVKAQGFIGNWSEPVIPAPSLSEAILSPVDSLKIGLYLPESYVNSNKNYPVIYFLQGYSMPVNPWVCSVMDSLLIEKKINEAIYVLISGVRATMGSFYVNSPVTGNWADFVTSDVINYLDANYRTIPKKESRALVGYSMGGYGALNLGLSHTHLYNVVYGISPGLFDKEGLQNSQMYNNQTIINDTYEKYKEFSSLSDKEAHSAYVNYLKSFTKFNNLELTLAYGMAFSPNAKHAPYFHYPYTINGSDTIFHESVWNEWYNGFGGVEKVIDDNVENIKKLKLLALNCGYKDHNVWISQGTHYYNQLFYKKGVPFQMVWHEGNHWNQLLSQLGTVVYPSVVSALEFE